jgi:RNA polymerase sigma-70 factor (ECF subfamily)
MLDSNAPALDLDLAIPGSTADAETPRPTSVPSRDGFVRDLLAIRGDLHARALRLTRDPVAADDLVQDSIERALRFRAQFQPGTSLRSWAQTIVFSLFVTGYRRRRRERDAVKILAVDPCAWTERSIDSIDASTLELSPPVRRAVEALPRAFREVILLVDVGELSYRDAAESLGVPLGTVMSRLHRARKQLAASLAPSSATEAPVCAMTEAPLPDAA